MSRRFYQEQDTGAKLKLEELLDLSFHAGSKNTCLVLTLNHLDQYIEENTAMDDESRTASSRSHRKAWAVIDIALSTKHFERSSDAASAREMWDMILNILERHRLLNNLAARRKLYTATLQSREKVLSYLNRVKQFDSTLNSIGVETSNQQMAMAKLKGLLRRFDNFIVAPGDVDNAYRFFTLNYVKSRLLRKGQHFEMRDHRAGEPQ